MPPARPAELLVKRQRSKVAPTFVAMSKAPPKLEPKFESKWQSVKVGLELLMYPAPPPNEQRLAKNKVPRIVGLAPETHRMPPPRSSLAPAPLALPERTTKPSSSALALVKLPLTTWKELSVKI